MGQQKKSYPQPYDFGLWGLNPPSPPPLAPRDLSLLTHHISFELLIVWNVWKYTPPRHIKHIFLLISLHHFQRCESFSFLPFVILPHSAQKLSTKYIKSLTLKTRKNQDSLSKKSKIKFDRSIIKHFVKFNRHICYIYWSNR